MQAFTRMEYTVDDIYALPEGERAELIDGDMYMMSPPGRMHQRLVSEFDTLIRTHIKAHHGECEVYPAPFAVFLNADDKTYVEPDLSIICDKDKLDDRGCNGAPDWVIEIVSPSSLRMDCLVKLRKYQDAGVREYWIVNPEKETVLAYFFEDEKEDFGQYSFEEDIPVRIYDGWSVNIGELLKG
ncbi:MAG: Uma2 family endonuclease [Firmicutes bacterium]|nr:Uma2 family endonuclease [Bacillota bacterium]